MKKIMVFLVFIFAVTTTQAQTSSTGMAGFKKNLATVMFAGLGGAVLGLSTLSFYGKPEEHIGNIWLGLGVGLIGGTVYVSMQPSATKTDYGKTQWPQNPHQKSTKAQSLMAYQWSF